MALSRRQRIVIWASTAGGLFALWAALPHLLRLLGHDS